MRNLTSQTVGLRARRARPLPSQSRMDDVLVAIAREARTEAIAHLIDEELLRLDTLETIATVRAELAIAALRGDTFAASALAFHV